MGVSADQEIAKLKTVAGLSHGTDYFGVLCFCQIV